MDLSTLYSKIQPGEGYLNMRGSEYLDMDQEDDDAETQSVKTEVNPHSGEARYINQNVLSSKSPEQEALMAPSVQVVNERQDENKNKTPPRSLPGKNPIMRKNPARVNGSVEPRLKPGQDGSGDVSAKSTGSSGFHSDYNTDNVAVPPHYSAVIRDVPTGSTQV